MAHPSLDEPRFRAALEHLGEPGSRHLLATPALECDLDLLEENVRRMAARTTTAGVALRPHVKSHKSSFVAARQLDAGAAGLAFAKLSEAEAVVDRLSDGGLAHPLSALITSPLVGAALATRAARLAERCALVIVVDDVQGVDELASSCSLERPLEVVCDVDVGLGRTGVRDEDQAMRVVDAIAQHPQLRLVGVQGYGGHLQHVSGRGARYDATARSTDRLRAVVERLERNGHAVTLRTGGGTGTASIDLELGFFNELQCGSYVFMDREYRDALGDDEEGRFEQSLTIATTVISTNQVGFVTVDAGLKAMATDAGAPSVVGHEGASFQFFGDEQGLVTHPGDHVFERGERLRLVPPHCDPTVDRYDVLWLVRGDTVVDVATIDARGASQ